LCCLDVAGGQRGRADADFPSVRIESCLILGAPSLLLDNHPPLGVEKDVVAVPVLA
jgi:hypothetical protein